MDFDDICPPEDFYAPDDDFNPPDDDFCPPDDYKYDHGGSSRFKRNYKNEKIEESGVYRECEKCLQSNIDMNEPSWKKICKNCFLLSKQGTVYTDFRNCENCGEKTIAPEEPSFKTKCKECFIKSRNNQQLNNEISNDTDENNLISNLRKCIKCNEYNIRLSEPQWKKTCYECYLKDKNETQYRLCNGCGKPAIKTTDPEWRKLCYTCFKTQNNK